MISLHALNNLVCMLFRASGIGRQLHYILRWHKQAPGGPKDSNSRACELGTVFRRMTVRCPQHAQSPAYCESCCLKPSIRSRTCSTNLPEQKRPKSQVSALTPAPTILPNSISFNLTWAISCKLPLKSLSEENQNSATTHPAHQP